MSQDLKSPWVGTDAEFLALLTQTLFITGFDERVVRRRWPAFTVAFAGFDVDAVAAFDEPHVERLVAQDSDIIRNNRKVRATVANASACAHLRQEHGSLREFVAHLHALEQSKACAQLVHLFVGIGEAGAKALYQRLFTDSRAT
ncbi:MAG: DNA-3-methyladenine glycosylase I [Firmicutes bacterium]|nr:DNA-3-methyladenine glycosylase I [Bacillota bacterium]